MYTNTTGCRNTAVGTNALKFNTTGLNNTASGYYSMINNTKGSIVSKIEGIISKVAKKHSVKVNDIEDYFDNELIK